MSLSFKVAQRYVHGATFTPSEWKTYQKKHPGAQKRNHQIKEISQKLTFSEKLDKVFNQIKGANQTIVNSLKKAPKITQRFFLDTSFRNDTLKKVSDLVKSSPVKIKNKIIESGKTELKAIFIETPKILTSLIKEKRKPTKKELKTLYGVGVYVAGTLLSLKGDTAMGVILAGSKAFGHSLTLHIAFRSMSSWLDESFLAYEALESAATTGGVAKALPFATGDIPGLNQIWDTIEGVGKALIASEKNPLDLMIEKLIEEITQELSKGVSEKELIKILKAKSLH